MKNKKGNNGKRKKKYKKKVRKGKFKISGERMNESYFN